MSEKRISDPTEDPSPIDPPGNTGPEAGVELDSPTSAEGDGAIDPPGNT
jgi:hypothetical protein